MTMSPDLAMGFAAGGRVTGPVFALVGEAGEEAIIPMRNHAVDVRMTPRGPEIHVPSGEVIPVHFPAFALGGIVGAPARSGPRVSSAIAGGMAERGGGKALTVNQHFEIKALDANSFRQSQRQIIAESALALERARKRDL